MSLHFSEHWWHVEVEQGDAHLSNLQRVVFVTCMIVFFLAMFVFL